MQIAVVFFFVTVANCFKNRENTRLLMPSVLFFCLLLLFPYHFTKCMVNIAKFYLEFTVDESCGKCTPCRIGTKRMLEILEKITNGEATKQDLEKLEELAKIIPKTSVCGLGQSAPNPVISTLKYFREEYLEHIEEKKCRTGECKALAKIQIDPEKCRGCTKCSRNCPVGAITGEPGKTHHINEEKCIKCGTCLNVCPFHAIG